MRRTELRGQPSAVRAAHPVGWASVHANGLPVNVLLDATPHPLGRYAVLRDGERAVNLLWAHERDPGADWLAYDGPRYRDHFTTCAGAATMRHGPALVTAVVETIGEEDEWGSSRPRHRTPTRRLRDWV